MVLFAKYWDISWIFHGVCDDGYSDIPIFHHWLGFAERFEISPLGSVFFQASLSESKLVQGFGSGNNVIATGYGTFHQQFYPLVNQHNYGKSSFIVDFPMKNSDFP